MAWEPITIIEIPDLTEKDREDMDLTGFVQWADPNVAQTWIEELYKLTRPAVEAQYDAKPFFEQRSYVNKVVTAWSQVYRALNLRWQYDPALGDIYRDFYGNFIPSDNPPCEPILQFVALLSTTNFNGKNTSAQYEKFDAEIWRKLKGDRALVDVMVYDPERAQYEISVLAAQDRGRPVPVEPPGLPPRRYVKKMEVPQAPYGAVLVVPAYLDFSSRPVVLSYTYGGADNSVPTQRFDGVFTGAACGVPPVERPKDQVDSWSCCLWDDAPLNTVRWLPPLKWSMPFLRAVADSLKARGARRIVMDTRIRCILENLARARALDMTTSEIDESIIDTMIQLKKSRFASEEDRATLQAASGAVCGTVSLVNPAAGGVCAGLAVVANALAGIIPLAVGCDIDAWGQPMPSGIEPRISRGQPPEWTPAPPAGVEIVDTSRFNVLRGRGADQLAAVKMSRADLGASDITTVDPSKLPPDPIKDGGTITPKTTKSSGAAKVVGLGLGAWLLSQLVGGK